MIVLTGAAGFIGANTLRGLNNLGVSDLLLVDDIGDSPKWKHLVGCRYRDYVHKDELWEWLGDHEDQKVDAIIHLGACSDTTEEDFDYLVRNNVRYSQRLWHLCVRFRAPFIYASSAATYGGGGSGFSDDHADIDDLSPQNRYGYSKHMFDTWALDAEEVPPVWAGLKFFNVYGPYEGHKGHMASVVRHAYGQIQSDGRVQLFKSHREGIADGEQKRDFVFVGDAVEVILRFLEEDAPSGLYNVGTGNARTYDDLAAAVFAALDRKLDVEYVPMPEELRDQYQYFTRADNRKIGRAGIKSSWTRLEEGVRRYVSHLERRRST